MKTRKAKVERWVKGQPDPDQVAMDQFTDAEIERQESPQAKHTAGPWKLKESLITNYHETITVVDLTGAMGGENTDADARLIACAPELLELLKRMVNQAESLPEADVMAVSYDQIVTAQELIAKASNGDTTNTT